MKRHSISDALFAPSDLGLNASQGDVDNANGIGSTKVISDAAMNDAALNSASLHGTVKLGSSHKIDASEAFSKFTQNKRVHPLGIYEKALPKNLSWQERLVLAKTLGFDFVEISIDETDERLSRLKWSKEERKQLMTSIIDTGIYIPSMCLSAHRRFPFGSHDEATRERAFEIMEDAIQLAKDVGIRTIQLAGYDVYYEEQDEGTLERFREGLQWAVKRAAASHVMLSVEIMDTAFLNSITKWKHWESIIKNPWFTVYPDVGNLSAWDNDVKEELKVGIDRIAAIHLKDTFKVTKECKGQFRDVPFGDGCVNFVEVFKTLKELNYRGAFLIEMWTEKATEPLLEIVKARNFIEEKMKEGELVC